MTINENNIIKQLASTKTQREAFGWLVSQYGQKLYWVIRRIVLSHETADDVLQNTFLKAWNRLDNFRGQSKVYTWLYRIAVNEALDQVRHEKLVSAAGGVEDISVANRLIADEYFDGDKTHAMLQEAVSKLPDVQRTVFNMRYFEEMKYSEMSEILGTSEGALKASYHIAVKKITQYLKNGMP